MHAQPGAQEAPASDSSSDASGTSASWAELHQLLLSSIGACLAGDKPSLLAARACCCAWRAALSPQLRQLRLHVAPGASSSGVGGPPPGSLLASSLARGLPGVTSVTLVLTHHTSDDDLAGALASVGAQERISSVCIWEVAPVSAAGCNTSSKSRYAAASLRLSLLQHVRRLSIRSTLTWTLADVWQQVASMGDGRLECLTITQLAPSSAQLVCQMPERLPPSLTQLQTPLPGQTARSGSVACTLAASHSRYLAGLARLLPQLRSLRVLGSMEGDTDVLPGFQALTELQVCVGGLFRAFSHLGDSSSVIRPLLCMPQLARLTLRSDGGAILLVEPAWLQAAGTQLQHLTASLTQSAGDVPVSQQLRSLCALHMPRAPEVLRQVEAIGGGLTSLSINSGGYASFHLPPPPHVWHRPPVSLQATLCAITGLRRLVLVAEPAVRVSFTLPDPAAVWAALPHLTALKLQGVGFGGQAGGRRSGPGAPRFTWRDLWSANSSSTSRAIAALEPDALELLPLALLPPAGLQLQQLELSRYCVTLTAEQAAAAAAAWQPSMRAEQQRRRRPGSLQRLVLAHCCAAVEAPPAVACRSEAPAGEAECGSSSTSSAAARTVASMWQLLQLLGCCAGGGLSQLQLLHVPLGADDFEFVGSQLGDQLQQLHMVAASRAPPAPQAQQQVLAQQQQEAAWLPGGASGAAVLARCAAQTPGQLQQLRELWLDLSASACGGAGAGWCASCSTSVFAHVAAFGCSLQQLKLVLDMRQPEAAGGPGACVSCSSGSRGQQAREQASIAAALQHLRVLDVHVLVAAGALQAHGPAEQLGGSSGGLEAVRRFLKQTLPVLLPASEVRYAEATAGSS